MQHGLGWWIGFNLFVFAMLAIDLGLFNRRAREASFRESLGWVATWVSLALLFALGLWMGWFGEYAAVDRNRVTVEFITGYLIEQSLSVDNVFVFVVIFTYFAVPPAYQRKVLFYGILGALIFRGIFIGAGLWLIERFHWTIYVLGGLLIFTGINLAVSKEKEIKPDRNPVVRMAKRALPMTDQYVGASFFARIGGRWFATPLFIVLIVVETTDVLFAVDSIPAILAITTDPFIVYTSNVFAILGLRSLYFVVSGFMKMFAYLNYGLSIVLIFVGVKMLLDAALHFKIHPLASLAFIIATIGVSVVLSVLFPPPHAAEKEGQPQAPLPAPPEAP